MDYLIRGSDYLARHEGFQLLGRDADLERLISVLMLERASSVVLTGAGGVGCTALCLGVQAAKNLPDAPFDLVSKRLFWLDTNGLFGNGDPRDAFHKITARLNRTRNSVLVVEDARDFIESCRSGGLTHFVNALLASVRAGGSQVIFETKEEDLDLVLRSHSDVRELFTVFPLEEPAGEALLAIVRGASAALTSHHGVRIGDDALLASVELTTKYPSGTRAQPERSVTLLDRALASYRLWVHRHPPGYGAEEWERTQAQLRALYTEQREGEVAITLIEEQIEGHLRQERPGALVGFEPPEVSVLRGKTVRLQAAVDELHTRFAARTAEINAALELTREHVLTEFSVISGIPASKLDRDEIEKLRGLRSALSARIYGQEEVISRVADGVKVARVGRRSGRPLAYLFLGPSGVGKTELSKALAGALLDDEAALTRFDMSEYMEKHAVAKMIGAPPGYEGFEAGGILTNMARKNPNRVYLFDEIEKAHPDVFNIFLQVLGDGRLTDNLGRPVSFADAVVIMTTNLGQPHFLDESLSHDGAEAAALEDLGIAFRSELLNRFAGRQNILCFQRLGVLSMVRIVQRELRSLGDTYAGRGVTINADPGAVSEFCADHYDARIGARGLPGYLAAHLEPVLVNAILDGKRGTARIGYADQRFHVEI